MSQNIILFKKFSTTFKWLKPFLAQRSHKNRQQAGSATVTVGQPVLGSKGPAGSAFPSQCRPGTPACTQRTRACPRLGTRLRSREEALADQGPGAQHQACVRTTTFCKGLGSAQIQFRQTFGSPSQVSETQDLGCGLGMKTGE